VNLFLCFFNWAPRHEGVLEEWRYSFMHFDLGSRCMWVVSFTSRPLYLQGKSPCYPLNRRLSGLQRRSERGDEGKISSSRQESNPRIPIVQPVTQRYTDWAITTLSCTYLSTGKLCPGTYECVSESLRTESITKLYAYLRYHPLLYPSKGYGGKTH
jgi:hypothetical protein